MRIAALIIGILAGMAGILVSLFALAVGGIGGAVGTEGASTVGGLGWAALVDSLIGFLGAGLTMAKPRLGATILLLCGLLLILFTSMFSVIAAPLFLIAALLAFLSRSPKPKRSPAVPTTESPLAPT